MKTTKLLLTMAALGGLAIRAHATIIVNDTWQDQNRTNPPAPVYSEFGVDSDADGDIESAWFSSTGTNLFCPAPGILRGIVPAGSASWNTFFTPEGSEITLSSQGDTIRVTWVFTPTGVNAADTSTGFRFAIANSPPAQRLTNDVNLGNDIYPGYAMFMNMAQTLGGSIQFRLLARNIAGGISGYLANSGAWTTLASSPYAGIAGYADGVTYTNVFTAVVNGLGGLDITNTMTGGNLGGVGQLVVGYTDPTPNTLTFDTFGIRPSGLGSTATNFDTSLFKVEFIQVCTSASVVSNATDTTVAVGQNAKFTILAAGGAPTKQWQVSTDNGASWNNVATGTGGTTTTFTTDATTLADSGNKYRCIVNVTCDSSSVTSSPPATLTVVTPKNLKWVGGGANLWDTSTANWTGDATIFSSLDAVRFDDSGNNATPIDLVGTIMPSSMVVSNMTKDYTIGTTTTGSLGDQPTLTKTGAGKLTLRSANSFVGKTTVNGGTLSIDKAVELGATPTSITPDQLTLDGGALQVTASTIITATRGTTLGAAGGTYDIPAGIIFTNQPVVTGPGSLTKTGDGTLKFSGVNSFAGNVTINAGIVSGIVQNSSGNSAFGALTNSRTITVNNGATLSFDTGNVFASGTTTIVTPAPQLIINQGCTLRTVVADGNNFGKITLNSATFALGIGFSANFGAAILTDTFSAGGSAASTVTKDPFSLFTAANLGYQGSTNGVTFDVADATGDANADLIFNAPLWNAANTTVAATNISLVKTGAGTLHLNDANTYTGLTVISNGVLAGSGSIAGSVEVKANGKIGGGAGAGIGTLSVGGNLTFNGGGAYFRVDRSGPASDSLLVSGVLTNSGSGTVAVNNIGAALQLNDKFTIFSQAVANGDLMGVTGGGVTWSNGLAVDGSIMVISLTTIASYSTNIAFSVNGSTLTIGWPGTHLGWLLQSQTNSLSVGLTTPAITWFDVSGSDTITQKVITINPANPTVFYRLRHP